MIAVIISEFNKEIVDGLLEGCKKSLKDYQLHIIKAVSYTHLTLPTKA